ncbi:MAG: ABC transporter substrate-binding protein [Acidimicrobiia bacterium]
MKRRLAALSIACVVIAAACSRDEAGNESTESTEDAEGGGAAGLVVGDTFGSIDFPCGENEEGGEVADAPEDEIQGVTADSIKVGTFADPGFEAAPGVFQEMFDLAEAFVEECNAHGGVNGKQLDLTLRDSKLFEYLPRVEEACGEDFAVVGGGAAFDENGAQMLTDCGLVSFPGFVVSANASLADNVVLALPNVPEVKPGHHLAQLLEELEEDGAGTGLDVEAVTQNAGILTGDIQGGVNFADQSVKSAEELGFEFVYNATYNIAGEANWSPFVSAMQNAGVELLNFVGVPDYFVQLQEAMDEFGYAPAIILQEANFNDADYATGIEGLNPDTLNLVRSPYWPFARAEEHEPTRLYLDLIETYVSDAVPAELGLQGLSAWLLFATAASECDRNNDLTRSCLYDTAKGFEEWTAGGLHAPTNPKESRPSECGLIFEVKDGTIDLWRPQGDTPDDAYFCDPDSVIEIQGDYGEGAKRQT